MRHTTYQNLCWEVAEHLWQQKTDEEDNQYWQRRIKDLVIQEHKLRLMVAIVPLDRDRYAILNHVYAIDRGELPPNIKLTLLSEDNKPKLLAEHQDKSPYIRLYFTTRLDVRFNICISVANVSITEAFEV
jgi:hypothetical protein